MNNYKITFEDIRKISDALQKGHIDIFLNYLNSFSGNNIYEKFINILNVWSNDVSPHLSFKLKDATSNVSIKYLLSDMEMDVKDIKIKKDNVKFKIGIPEIFVNNEDILPIYTTLKKIEMLGVSLDLNTIPIQDRKGIIDGFPAQLYTIILNGIIHERSKVLKYSHPALENFKLNFLTNDVFNFLKHMFIIYDDFYFRDIIYYLSPKLGSNLNTSTMQDIDYYIKKLDAESNSQKEAPHL